MTNGSFFALLYRSSLSVFSGQWLWSMSIHLQMGAHGLLDLSFSLFFRTAEEHSFNVGGDNASTNASFVHYLMYSCAVCNSV